MPPPLTDASASVHEGTPATPFDMKRLAVLVRKLSDLQVLFGGCLIYGDPADATEAARELFRESALRLDSGGSDNGLRQVHALIRFLSSLTEEQWEQSVSAGLVIGKDLTLPQQSAFKTVLSGGWVPASAPRQSLVPAQQRDLELLPRWVIKIGGEESGSPGLFRVRLIRGDDPPYEWRYQQPVAHPARPRPGATDAGHPSRAASAGP